VVTKLYYQNGIVIYSSHPAFVEDNITSHTTVLSAFANQYPPSAHTTTLPNGVSAFGSTAKELFMYNAQTKFIERVELGTGTFKTTDLSSLALVKINKLEVNEAQSSLVLYDSTSKTHNKMAVNGKDITGFDDILDATWFGSYLLVIDNYNLYTYNVSTNKRTLLKTDVSELSTFGGNVYYRERDGSFYEIKLKKQA
jgi:hypothetical protein